MRGGKDEKKQMDPLFPRLHINDTEKGGPRAPPRNKMALCEEINVSPQRSSSGSTSMRPLPTSGSQSHVGCPQKSRFSLFCSLPGSSKMAEGHHSYSSSLMNSETRLINPGNYKKYSIGEPSKIIAERHLFRPFNLYNSENSSVKILGKVHDLRVPYFAQLDKTSHYGGIGHRLEEKKLSSSSSSFSGKHQSTPERKEEEEVRSTDIESKELLRDRTNDSREVSQMSEDKPETLSPLSIDKKILVDAAASQLTRNITSESGTRAPMYHARCKLANDKIRLLDPCAQSHRQCRTSLEDTDTGDGIYENLERFSRKRSYSMMEGPSFSSAHPGESNRTPNIIESVNECQRGNDLEVGDAKRSVAVSDTSVVESKSGFNISPDDVVGVIGPKLFWKVRRTIAHQQRIFAVQIFELHRIIKVQRLIAKSPEMLSEDTLHISKPSTKCSPVKKLLPQNIPEATSPLIKPKVDSQKPHSSPETAAEDAHIKLPPVKCDSEKGNFTPKSTLKPYSDSSTSTSFASHAKLGPWYFHPGGSQWLVPVRLPSEGLVYKPYTGPRTPIPGCIAPLYGSCGSTSLTRMDYRAPSHQGGHFQPHAIPLVNTSNSSKNLLVSNGSDLHGSTASSPFERVQGDAFSFLPINPTVHTSNKSILSNNTKLQRVEVIKVVPHNPKSAYESAARIFRSIQEERQKHD